MLDENIYQYEPITSSNNLKAFVRNLGIDLVGIADLRRLGSMPIGVPSASGGLLKNFCYAVVLGAQLNKLRRKATGSDVNLVREKASIDVLDYFLRCFSRWLYCW